MKTLESKKEANHLVDRGLLQALEASEALKQKNPTAKQYQGWIDLKRQRRRWEETHRLLFLSIGLFSSLLLVNIAFNWETQKTSTSLGLSGIDQTVNELIDIPISKQPPPAPPKKAIDLFVIKEVNKEVFEEIIINLDVEANEESEIAEIVFEIPTEEEKVDEIFTIVETRPEPTGGMKTFNQYLAENIKYPGTAIRMGISGRVFVEFIVEKDGSLTDITVVKGIGAGCDEEAVRVLVNAPDWSPGKQRGQAVRVRMILPVRFVLGG